MSEEVIELLSSSEDEADRPVLARQPTKTTRSCARINRRRKRPPSGGIHISNKPRLQGGLVLEEDTEDRPLLHDVNSNSSISCAPVSKSNLFEDCNESSASSSISSGAGTTLECYLQEQAERKAKGLPSMLYHDEQFKPVPSSIEGQNICTKTVIKCRCSPPQPAVLSYSKRKYYAQSKKDDKDDEDMKANTKQKENPNHGRPYHHCAKRKCKFFRWAYTAHLMRWYRFGAHNAHVLVHSPVTASSAHGFDANHLLQGKVGDCWFLSALAVVAQRPDLIQRLFEKHDQLKHNHQSQRSTYQQLNASRWQMNDAGIVEITLFVDGYWTNVLMDNFLPCLVDEDDVQEERNVQTAITNSLNDGNTTMLQTNKHNTHLADATPLDTKTLSSSASSSSSSLYNPHAMSHENQTILQQTATFLHQHRQSQYGFRTTPNPSGKYSFKSSSSCKSTYSPTPLQRHVTSTDLAYSKTKHQQLWVPLLEKAYAKVHGSYHAISGGYIHEAFLDLTGAPTLEFVFHTPGFCPRQFWYQLLSYRRRELPMGCGTGGGGGGGAGLSQVGLVSMHAYSILDVQEVRNVSVEFFQEVQQSMGMGNVSGFTNYDGCVRLLQIRNPHGKGEWKGAFSDGSHLWERLLASSSSFGNSSLGHGSTESNNNKPLRRTMQNDGTFWMDYDHFLMGFTNVDVVLAFKGNHGRSFHSHFADKKSNHRCTRAFEVCLVEPQPGVPSTMRDTVEVYILGIQKNRRGASHGRSDRKKSYKVSDLGFWVGWKKNPQENENKPSHEEVSFDEYEFSKVEGSMLGFKRNGHYRLVLTRKSPQHRSFIVMPVSFGHPAATDAQRSFVVRFVSDAPLMIRELPCVPRMDRVVQSYCLSGTYNGDGMVDAKRKQGRRRLLLEDSVGLQLFGQPTHRVYFVDCLANGGGTAFVYLFVNDQLITKSNQELKAHQGRTLSGASETPWKISFSVEVNCRGMICRTEDGLLQHETVSKGKKFEASWRRFQVDFYNETKSRLLMVVAQSGMDTEMGTVSCRRIDAGRCLGSGDGDNANEKGASFNGKNHNCQEKVTKYFERSPSKSAPQDKKTGKKTNGANKKNKGMGVIKNCCGDYETRGIFNATDDVMKKDHCSPASLGAALVTTAVTFSDASSPVDLDLEQALALSRGDLDLQRAIEASKRDQGKWTEEQKKVAWSGTTKDGGAKQDMDMERAILASLKDTTNPLANGLNESNAASSDLERAIHLSLQQHQQDDKRDSTTSNITDKAMKHDISRPIKCLEACHNTPLVDVDSASVVQDGGQGSSTGKPQFNRGQTDTVIVLDADDNTEADSQLEVVDMTEIHEPCISDKVLSFKPVDSKSTPTTVNLEETKPRSSPTSTIQVEANKPPSMDHKRKLAAEAALRRLNSITHPYRRQEH